MLLALRTMAENPSSSRKFTTDEVISVFEKGSFSEIDVSNSDEDQDFDLSDPEAMTRFFSKKALVIDD